MEHSHSILYGPINAIWDWLLSVTGLAGRWGHIEVPDHVAMALFVVALITAIVVPLSRNLSEDNPGKVQLLFEEIVLALRSMIDGQAGHGASKSYLPLIGAFTFFIFLCNFCGLFFFLSVPTSNTNTTFALAFISFFFYNFIGIKRHGFGYLKHFMGPIWWLAPLIFVVEIVSHNARWLSLGLRLFGNMFGEHTVSGVFNSLVPLLVPLPLMAIGLFAAVIQTFIFIILTTVYIAGAEAEEH